MLYRVSPSLSDGMPGRVNVDTLITLLIGGRCVSERCHVSGSLTYSQEHDQEFEIIALMAKDFLAVPGASVTVERLFSGSRHVGADTRTSMRAVTITELMCA